MYVTVLVTTDRTLTGLLQALRGVSQYRLRALSRVQSAGEKGEYMALPVGRLLKPVRGDGPQVLGEYAGEGGMRSRRSPDDVRRKGVGGTEFELRGDCPSLLFDFEDVEEKEPEIVLSLVAVESSEIDRDKALGGGLAAIGVKALRKSV